MYAIIKNIGKMKQFVFDGIEFESDCSNVKAILNNIVGFKNKGGLFLKLSHPVYQTIYKDTFGEVGSIYKMISASNSVKSLGLIIVKPLQLIIIKNYVPSVLTFVCEEDLSKMVEVLMRKQ